MTKPFLSCVSLTGADDAVPAYDLITLVDDFPYVEWAVLYDPQKQGENRYPTEKWILEFSSVYDGPKAMHLCNTALIRFAKGDDIVKSMMTGYDRIQLNFKFGGAGKKTNMAGLVEQVKSMPEKTFILQFGEVGAALLSHFDGAPNVAILFDQSAGEGKLPSRWPEPLTGYDCGYAGGLNPDNVEAQIKAISAVAPDYTTWIDMETGIRTNDYFDLQKARRVLEIAQPYIREE